MTRGLSCGRGPRRPAAWIAAWLGLGACTAFAQPAITSASLSGQVEDATGAVLARAAVTVTHLDQSLTRAVVADERGRFRFAYLPVGRYRMRVEAPGFAPLERRLTLTLGETIDARLRLSLLGRVEKVNVSATLPVVEAGRTQIAETVTGREIESLPLNGRNYLDLALLAPGVSRTNTGNNERFAETSSVPGTGISIAGQRNLANGFIVDGLSANDDAADLPGTFFSQEVIREFQLVTSGGIAEFGRAASGTVNILTQSGSNAWRGAAYGFLRNQRFDAANIFANTEPATGRRRKSPWTQAQYGASTGGPLRRDRLFLFANFEQERLRRSGFITISEANAAAVNAVLDRTAPGLPRVVTGEYPTGLERTNFFAKADANLGAAHRLSTRYSLYDLFSPNARSVGGLGTVSRGTAVGTRDQSITVSDVATLSVHAVNETRFQATRSRVAAPGNDLVGPAVSITGVANLGASTTSPTGRDIDLVEFADSASLQKGAHFLKAGVDLVYNRVDILFPGSVFGSYGFGSLAAFLTGSYNTFQQAFGRVDWRQSNPNLGWFVQDEWKPRSGLTVNAGLRHDTQWLPDPYRTGDSGFSPRLGLAYAPRDRRTVIRAGAGLYLDRIPLRAVANALRGSGLEYKQVSLQRGQLGAPVFPDKLAAFPAGALYGLATLDARVKRNAALQASLQVERELRDSTAVSVGYLYLRGLHVLMNRNLNVPTLTAAQDPVNLGRPDPRYQNITQYSGQGDSYYHGMTVSFRHRPTGWAAGRLSYTLSKAIDNTGNAFFSSPMNNFDLRADRGLSDNDQRHRLALSGELIGPASGAAGRLPGLVRGFRLSGIFTYASAYPFNIVTGAQTLQTTPARVGGRNTGVGFEYASLDLRVSRRFGLGDRAALQVMAEGFNVLNRTNRQFPNPTFGTATAPLASFGAPTGAADPRQIQFGLRILF